MKRITFDEFRARLERNGITVKGSVAFWRGQLAAWRRGDRGPDMHDNALSTLAELEGEA